MAPFPAILCLPPSAPQDSQPWLLTHQGASNYLERVCKIGRGEFPGQSDFSFTLIIKLKRLPFLCGRAGASAHRAPGPRGRGHQGTGKMLPCHLRLAEARVFPRASAPPHILGILGSGGSQSHLPSQPLSPEGFQYGRPPLSAETHVACLIVWLPRLRAAPHGGWVSLAISVAPASNMDPLKWPHSPPLTPQPPPPDSTCLPFPLAASWLASAGPTLFPSCRGC